MPAIELDEPIRVVVDFSSAKDPRRPIRVAPLLFFWKNRRYLVSSLNLVHHAKEGEATVYYFAVSTATNTYKLSFNNLSLEWRLVEIWNE